MHNMTVGMWGASVGILLTLVAAAVLLVALMRLGIFPPKEVPFYFFIPLKAKQFSENWDLVCRNLERTIANLLAQLDPNFSIIVVCNDLPSFLDRRQRRIEVVTIESRIQSAKQSMGFVEAACEAGHTLEPFDFHAAIYVVNHGENDQRLKGKNDRKVLFVQRHCFGGLSKIHSLAEAFPACSP